MKVTKEQLDKVQVALTIEVEDETFQKAVEDAYKEQKNKISIPGFRKGKAPRALIEQHYGKDYFYYDAADHCVYPAYIEALKEDESIQPLAQPKIEPVQLEVGKPFIFKAIVDTKQDITLGEYKGIELEKEDDSISDDEISAELTRMQNNAAMIETVTDADAAVESGDAVIMDFLGKKDGVPFDGGSAEDFELAIGSNSFIPGFEDGMIGMAVGEEKDIDLTFPEEYPAAELAGAPVVFTVKVKEIKRKKLMPLDDEFAKDVSDLDTLDALKEDIAKDLQERKATMADNNYKQKISSKVTEDSDVVAPASLVERESENFLNDLTYNMRSQGIELEQYLQLTGGSMDDIKKDCDVRAEASVKQQLVLEEIAAREDITVSDEEIEEEYEKLAGHYQMEKDQLKQIFLMQGQSEALRRNILMEKTVNFLLAEAKIG